ncbi:MAG: lipoxygenase family protein [Planctomycetota bacterium]|nr:lipoxygenase family protein [Planctomycetota bacterium]
MRRDPDLPQNDPKQKAREKELSHRASDYSYVPAPTEEAPDNVREDNDEWVKYVTAKYLALAEKIHFSDEYTPKYISKVLKLRVEMKLNHFKSELEGISVSKAEDTALESDGAARLAKAMLKGEPPHHYIRDLLFGHSKAASKRAVDKKKSLADYSRLFATIDKTPIIDWMSRSTAERDLVFAWQRVAGVNPMVMRRQTEKLPDHFPVTNEIFSRVIPGDSLDAALGEGRLYLCDYAALDGAEVAAGKYLWAPMALFAWRKPSGAAPTGALVPVAIQCGQVPSADSPIWTPFDGYRWEMAKRVVQIADANHHQAIAHLGRTHMTVEPFIVSAYRKLAPNHPVSILLEPHFDYTLAINNTAAHALIAPGGAVESVLAGTLETSIKLSASALPGCNAGSWRPDVELANRGLLDLPTHPYRDDMLPIWAAIHNWVNEYLRLYYSTDNEVILDTEVQAWANEVRSPIGGRLTNISAVQTIEGLVELVSFVIWTASAQHAAINYPQFPFLGYNPNIAGAGFAPAPTKDTPDTQDSWVNMMAPMSNALLQFDTLYQLSGIRMCILGEYRRGTFIDERIEPALEKFQSALREAEKANLARDSERLMSYPWLRSSLVTGSIHI